MRSQAPFRPPKPGPPLARARPLRDRARARASPVRDRAPGRASPLRDRAPGRASPLRDRAPARTRQDPARPCPRARQAAARPHPRARARPRRDRPQPGPGPTARGLGPSARARPCRDRTSARGRGPDRTRETWPVRDRPRAPRPCAPDRARGHGPRPSQATARPTASAAWPLRVQRSRRVRAQPGPCASKGPGASVRSLAQDRPRAPAWRPARAKAQGRPRAAWPWTDRARALAPARRSARASLAPARPSAARARWPPARPLARRLGTARPSRRARAPHDRPTAHGHGATVRAPPGPPRPPARARAGPLHGPSRGWSLRDRPCCLASVPWSRC